MRKLYGRSSRVDCAYLATGQVVFVGMPGGVRRTVPADRIVVGSVEHFLRNFGPRNETRLFDLYIEDDAEVKLIPFSVVDRMMTQFKFGYNTNIFLARLIELTNELYQNRSRKLPRNLWQYQVRAERYARLIDQVAELGVTTGMLELVELAQGKRKREMYEDGTILRRQNILRSISVPVESAAESIQKFPKNSCLCREGSPAESMYILLGGTITVGNAGRQIATISESGEAFGELALFLDGKRTATLVAQEDSLVFELRRSQLGRFFRTHRDLFLNIAQTLARRVHDNFEKISRFESKLAELEEEQRRSESKVDQLEIRSCKEFRELFCELLDLATQSQNPALAKLCENYGATRRG